MRKVPSSKTLKLEISLHFNFLVGLLMFCLHGRTPLATGKVVGSIWAPSVKTRAKFNQSYAGGRYYCDVPREGWEEEEVRKAYDDNLIEHCQNDEQLVQNAYHYGSPFFATGACVRRTTTNNLFATRPPTHWDVYGDEGKLICQPVSATSPNKMSAGLSQISAGGAKKAVPVVSVRPLMFWENMICGAISRSVAQVVMHPMNTMKTIMQANKGALSFGELAAPKNWKMLTRGAGAQFLLSVPHGAMNFAVLEFVRGQMNQAVQKRMLLAEERGDKKGGKVRGGGLSKAAGPGIDFLSSCISTITCSIVSTPHMMITDNIMAGSYPNLPSAVTGLMSEKGIGGFYTGWWPGLAGKIPSYALTWTFFQQLKKFQLTFMKRPPKDIENSIMGCVAAAATVCIMIPMDTIKTRLVTQTAKNVVAGTVPYKGIFDTFSRIAREEGVSAFYKGLSPRLLSVVPMIGIQFGVYEYMKKVMLARTGDTFKVIEQRDNDKFHEVAMEVGADDEQPFPAPFFQQIEEPIEEPQVYARESKKAQKTTR